MKNELKSDVNSRLKSDPMIDIDFRHFIQNCPFIRLVLKACVHWVWQGSFPIFVERPPQGSKVAAMAKELPVSCTLLTPQNETVLCYTILRST